MNQGPPGGGHMREFSQVAAMPFAGCIRSDLGADVVKLELRSGDPHRRLGAVARENEKRFQSLNRDTRSIARALKDRGGLDAIYRLVPQVDVVTARKRSPGCVARG